MNRNGGEIWRSANIGVTWQRRNTGLNYLVTSKGNNQGNYDNALWVAPDDEDVVVFGGIDLWRSTNGGTTSVQISRWQDYHDGTSAHGDQHAIVHHPDYGTNNTTIYVGNDGGIQRTDDILAPSSILIDAWDNLANNLGVTQFYRGAASPQGTVILGGTQDNSVLRYLAGAGSGEWYQRFSGDGGCCAVVGSNIMYSATQYLCILKSTDGGDSWSQCKSGLADACSSGTAAFVAPFMLDPSDNQTLCAGGLSIWHSNNAAASWVQIRSPLPDSSFCSALDIAATNGSRIWVGYFDGTVSYTPVNILNWIDVDDNPSGVIPEAAITDIAVNPTNEQEVFVTIGGTSSDRVWFSSNQGNTWQSRSGSGEGALPQIQVNTITFHPDDDDWIYVGTDIGIFVSENKGVSWNQTPRFGDVDTDGPVYTEVDDLFWYDDDGQAVLVAATHGRGMFRTTPLSVVYVDNTDGGGADENGSAEHPYDRVVEGNDAAGSGTTIAIRTGVYDETTPLSFRKRVKLVASGGGSGPEIR
jgi:hypothetical protein